MIVRLFFAIFMIASLMGGGSIYYSNTSAEKLTVPEGGQAKWVKAPQPSDHPTSTAPDPAPAATARPESDQQASDLRRFLPPALDGWTRFEWNDYADQQLTKAGHDGTVPKSTTDGRYLNPDEAMARVFRAQGTWVYAQGGKVLSIRAVHSKREYKGGGLRDPNAVTEDIDSKARLFTEIEGVRFFETSDKAWRGEKAPYRFYKAWLGNGVTLTVRARADGGAVRAYLRQIDYQGILAARRGKAPKSAGIPLLTILFGGRNAAPSPPEPAKPQVKINRGLGTD